jgi:hypothetical protein
MKTTLQRLWSHQTQASRIAFLVLAALALVALDYARIEWIEREAMHQEEAYRAELKRANPEAWAALEREWPDGSRSVR